MSLPVRLIVAAVALTATVMFAVRLSREEPSGNVPMIGGTVGGASVKADSAGVDAPVGARVASSPFVAPPVEPDGSVILDSKLRGYSRPQADLIRAIKEILDGEVPAEIVNRPLADAEIALLREQVVRYSGELDAARSRKDVVGDKLHDEYYRDGKWHVFQSTKIESVDPRDATRNVSRDSTPYDAAGPDDFVSMTGGMSSAGKPEIRVVHIRPSDDGHWKSAVDAFHNEVAALRVAARDAFGRVFKKE